VVFHFAAARVSPIEQVGKWNGSKMELTARMGNTLPNDSHQRAAGFHELAAREHSKRAMEHANKAFEWSQEANRKSEKSAGKP
jgi:hypothetical protein